MKKHFTEQLQIVSNWVDQLFIDYSILPEKLSKIPIDESIDRQMLFTETLKFLYLVSKSTVKLSPSHFIDLAWHEFILFTRAYEKFCNEELGKFVHHTPDNNKAANNRNYLKTIQLYIHTFGQPPEEIWGKLANEEWEDSQCGSCNSN